jgi:hypothetical protein
LQREQDEIEDEERRRRQDKVTKFDVHTLDVYVFVALVFEASEKQQ